ncbi:MAG: recombinase family protein [Alphaproteobacteria bacterium]|nr:MAG: recombinase family protein [Alphaproteobacteria bacterium]
MNSYFGYIRVSTAKQGTHGVSLIEQKSAIERCAARTDLSISEWFEERETAAKRGRPVFTRMLNLLRTGKARGVIMHKIDRSARNLKDWADLGELIDAGVEVHFAVDALDLASRGGRLSADIQAVVAADFIRNLREETRKGFYGRLKQGLYPLPAPMGYLNCGGGKEKTLDPKTAPLVRRTFELYATGKYSLRSLLPEVRTLGLTSGRGGTLSVNGLAVMLGNPFYCGVIRLRKTNQTFPGAHAPLLPVRLFERVQQVLHGKAVGKVLRHDWRYRRTIRCALCSRTLTGELQKGRVYYRCHTPACATTGVREDAIDAMLHALYACVQLTNAEAAEIERYIEHRRSRAAELAREAHAALTLQIADAKARMSRLTDALIDGALDRTAYDERRSTLLLDIARLEERRSGESEDTTRRAEELFELAKTLSSGYESANHDGKRKIREITTSNFSVSGNQLAITLSEPFLTLANRHLVSLGAPNRDSLRTTGMCPKQKKALRAFVDRLIEGEKKPPERKADSVVVPSSGGVFDPAVYNVIRAKRVRHKRRGDVAEFDQKLCDVTKRLNRKKAA